jgi:hypothetical protein
MDKTEILEGNIEKRIEEGGGFHSKLRGKAGNVSLD